MKNSWTYILASTALLGMAGCATSVAVNDPTVSAKLQEKAKTYRMAVRTIEESEVAPGHCYKSVVQVKAQWNWKGAVEAANYCVRAKDYQRVEEMGNELAVREPGAAWGPYYLGLAARETGNMERALWMSELALKRAPEISVLHYLKAQILWTQKEYKTAVASFERSIELDDSNLGAHLFLGQVYFRDQDFSKASKHFYSVIKMDAHHPVALAGLAESQLHENNPQSALDAYTRLAEAYPKDGQYFTRMGEIYETVLNDLPNALNMYRQVQVGVRSGRITKNVDPQNNSKIRELETTLQKTRALASTEDKKRGIR